MTVTDPNLEISVGPGHPDLYKKKGGGGGLQTIVFGPQFGLKIRGRSPRASPPDPTLHGHFPVPFSPSTLGFAYK